ncbi:MAG: peptide ABC transporter substrate-binding protein [Verrucomicrobia bacterium CG_4_10_14_3_um_filter_43_23]|nr:MAG: peptide ABC transporter substrate-binding protein [Verrucomicrobia bacterium CG22_combo_CG10-13_8_21_14_all_43_17]PIX57958.1 MAG: peptide ABC transporter substrate-binding protein [Verrucomicrobia bacterium CG_4_10_14_3_um_filter_43_23]PIY62840.1 MAG: peptide ABC transporter substrate-binding protein [Verrucomicrobia bacterium CG_4_10_14_0_8_um_filter_43_34]PJA44715.1 MAG: peptide ABC transporter substrate-binding protein [Verrucomicrobia bacterium CG_4_9_14_3_um_filter_43_20]
MIGEIKIKICMFCKLFLQKNLTKLTVISLFSLASLFLPGCSSNGTQSSADSKAKKHLNIGNNTDPASLDPQLATTVPESKVLIGLFEGLVTMHPENLTPEPGVAESWSVSEDGLTYTFNLRKNAKWSNGDPVTAQDFLFSYQRILTSKLGAPYAYSFYVVKGAEGYHKGSTPDFSTVGFKALNPYTFEITLAHPTPYFLALISHSSWYPVHKKTLEKFDGLEKRDSPWTRQGNHISNGPFSLTEWSITDKITITKNPHYWDSSTVQLDSISFYSMDMLTEERSYQTHQLDITDRIPPAQIPSYLKEHPEQVYVAPGLGTEYYAVNTAIPSLKDIRVRKALSLSLNRKGLVEHVVQGGQLPAYFFTPPNTAGYTFNDPTYEDIAEAKKLLAEAGYPEGKGFPQIEILYNTTDRNKQVAEAIQEMWKRNLGINVVLVNQEFKVYLNTRRSKNYQIARASWVGDYVDASNFLELFQTNSNNNFTNWNNPEYDALLQTAARTNNQVERMGYFQQAEAILMSEFPIIPLFFYSTVYLKRPNIKGWYPNLLEYHPYKYVFIE